jgi:hypothetical protein
MKTQNWYKSISLFILRLTLSWLLLFSFSSFSLAQGSAQDTVGNDPLRNIPVGQGATGTQTAPVTDIEKSTLALNFFQKDIGVYITSIVEVALIIGSILVLMYVLWGGVEWITSGGDKTKYESARAKITAAIFGIAIMAAAWALWLLVNYFFGIDKVIKAGGAGRAAGGTNTSAGSGQTGGAASQTGGSGVTDCCSVAGTSGECCDYMQSKGDYYVVGRYQYPQYCDQLYINWGLWQQDWQRNVGDPSQDKCG